MTETSCTEMLFTEMLCADCERVALFAPVPSSEDLDLMCVVCGTAVTLGGMLLAA